MDKKAIAENMLGLQESLVKGQLALMFEHIDELERLAGEEYAMKVLSTFATKMTDTPLVKDYIAPVLADEPELFKSFLGVELKGNGGE